MGIGAFRRARKIAEKTRGAKLSKSEEKRIAALTDYQNRPDSIVESVDKEKTRRRGSK